MRAGQRDALLRLGERTPTQRSQSLGSDFA
jgi:hypothetical protein